VFTDTEIILMHQHSRNVRAIVQDAQHVVDNQAARIAGLQRQLAAERGKTAGLLAERAARNAALIADRIGRRTH
jgi:hypothetical protein